MEIPSQSSMVDHTLLIQCQHIGRSIIGKRPDVIVGLGISHSPEGRGIFANIAKLLKMLHRQQIKVMVDTRCRSLEFR